MSSRNHHVEVSRRDQIGIALGWLSLAVLAIGLILYAGNAVLTLPTKIILGVGLALGVAYLAIRKNAALAVITSPSTGSRANATAFIVIVLGILGLVNYIASRHYHQFDLTKQRMYTLSPQTRELVKGLKDEVTVTAFYQLTGRSAGEGYQARDLLRRYKDLSPKLKVELIDPMTNPAKVMARGVRSVPITFVESGGRTEQVYSMGEQELTSAILKVTRPTKKKVYFLFGHGEHDIDSPDRTGMADAKSSLEKLNYETSKLILQTVKQVPEDAAVVVVAGPKKGIPDAEQKLLANYLAKGGKMLLLLDPMMPVPTQLVQPWGVQVGDNVIIDPRIQPGIALVQRFEFHQITKDLQTGIFPVARSVSAAANTPAGVTVTPLAKSGEIAWGETNLGGPYQQDDKDMHGPVSLGVVATKEHTVDTPHQDKDSKKSTRLVVFGDSDFATQELFSAVGASGGDLFLNAVNWLAEEEALVNIRPKEPTNNQITLLDSQSRFIFMTTVLLVPLGVLLAGMGVWWRRR